MDSAPLPQSNASAIFKLVTEEYNITVDNTPIRQVFRYWTVQEYKPSGLFSSDDLGIVTISNVVPRGIASVVATTGIVGLCILSHAIFLTTLPRLRLFLNCHSQMSVSS
jgi:hypothetical protein